MTAATQSPFELVLSKLQRIRAVAGKDKERRASCPGPRHERGDQNPSLSVSVGNDGAVLLKCHSQGCTAKEIVEAIGLELKDLFPHQAGNGHGKPTPAKGKAYPTAEDAIAYIGRGIALNHPGSMLAGQWDYHDAAGNVCFIVARWNLPGDAGKEFRPFHLAADGWRVGDPPGKLPLFGLPELLAADPSIPVYVVEGEGKARLLRSFGLLATCSAHGAKSAAKTDWTPLRGRTVIILPDADGPGKNYATVVSGILRGINAIVRIVNLPGLEPGSGDDVKEFVENRRGDGKEDEAIRAEIEALAAAAPEERQDATNDEQKTEPSPVSRYKCDLINSAAFAAGNYRPRWLVRRLFVEGMPGIIGGPRKALKTSLLIDLAVSLATGTPFLGEFQVYEAMRVAVLSGESGEHTLQETALRVCAAKGIDLAAADVLWGFRLPQLSCQAELKELQRALDESKARVLLFDPLYLALLSGANADGSSASNLFTMGPLLSAIAQACLAVGCTPLLVHHARKNIAGDRALDPLELEDLSFAGIQEFARQWLLINRRRKYSPGTGEHRLWLSAGGSIGSGGLWSVDVDEGILDDDFAGRKWEVRVSTATESREADAREDEKRKTYAQQERERAEDAKLLSALDKADPERKGYGYTRLRELAGIGGEQMGRIVARLTLAGIIEEIPGFTVDTGGGGKRPARGLRRPPIGPHQSTPSVYHPD